MECQHIEFMVCSSCVEILEAKANAKIIRKCKNCSKEFEIAHCVTGDFNVIHSVNNGIIACVKFSGLRYASLI